MLTATLSILALFLGLSLALGALVAVHDGIERLAGRRAARTPAPAGTPPTIGWAPVQARQTGGTAGRAWRVPASMVGGQGNERPGWLDAAGRDAARRARLPGPAGGESRGVTG